jgi:hypothetical protein
MLSNPLRLQPGSGKQKDDQRTTSHKDTKA